jgi:hypothetical protein
VPLSTYSFHLLAKSFFYPFLIPDTLFLIPDTLLIIPDILLIIPDTCLIIPDTLLIIPDTFLIIPDTLLLIPDTLFNPWTALQAEGEKQTQARRRPSHRYGATYRWVMAGLEYPWLQTFNQ